MNKSVLTKYSHWKIPDLCQLILVSIMRWDMKPWGIASESSRSYTTGPIELKAQEAWAAPHCMSSPGCPWTQNSLGWISFDTATHYGILRYLTLNQLGSIQMMTRLSLPRSQKPPIWRIPLGSWEMEGSISFGGGGRDANIKGEYDLQSNLVVINDTVPLCWFGLNINIEKSNCHCAISCHLPYSVSFRTTHHMESKGFRRWRELVNCNSAWGFN